MIYIWRQSQKGSELIGDGRWGQDRSIWSSRSSNDV